MKFAESCVQLMALTKYISFHWESHDVILTSGYPTVQVESHWRAAYLRSTTTTENVPPGIHKLLLRCPIVFEGHPSNFKVTRLKRIADFDPNWAFPNCRFLALTHQSTLVSEGSVLNKTGSRMKVGLAFKRLNLQLI